MIIVFCLFFLFNKKINKYFYSDSNFIEKYAKINVREKTVSTVVFMHSVVNIISIRLNYEIYKNQIKTKSIKLCKTDEYNTKGGTDGEADGALVPPLLLFEGIAPPLFLIHQASA